MINIIPKTVLLSLSLTLLSALAHGQDISAVSAPVSYQGFQLPATQGTLTYAISASENARTGYYGSGGTTWSSVVSGDVGFLSSSTARPFSLIYSGGFYSNTHAPTSVFQNLAVSQVWKTKNWNMVFSDAVSYLPETGSSGLSGIPGAGDVGIPPPQVGGPSGLDILSLRGQRVTNTTSASIQRGLTGSTSAQGSGSYVIQRFLAGASGFNTNQLSAQAGLNHRVDARTNVNGAYTYSKYDYLVSNFSLITQGINVGFTRQVTRQLGVDVSAGPQRSVNSANSSSSSTNFSMNANASYTGEVSSYSLKYARGVQGGSGYLQGTISDNLSITANRGLGPVWRLSSGGGYSHNKTLALVTSNPSSIETYLANVQLSRAVGRNFSGYLSYSLQHQSIQGSAVSSGAFSGLSHIVAVGLTYSPRPLQVGHQ